MPIRHATLDDTRAISQLFQKRIDRWQRINEQGDVQDLPYDDLSIYERWLHGGAWMSIETGALWLTHLRQGAGVPYVLERDSDVCAYVETYHSHEPPPFGEHVHIGAMATHDTALRDDLLQHLIDTENIKRLTVSTTAYDDDKQAFYRRYGFQELQTIRQVQISAQGGNVGFYKVSDHLNADPRQIDGWQMPIGRTESARQHWEQLWSTLWDAIPQMQERRIHRQQFNVGGQNAFVCIQQHLYTPRTANVYCWTSKSLTAQLINAIRDWTHQQGYRTLTLNVAQKIAAMLSDLETTPSQHVILVRQQS